MRGLAEVPLASARNDFLPQVGELSASAEFGWASFSDAGTLNRRAFGLSWEPRPFLRLRASSERLEKPASLESLGDPVIATPGVRILDLLTGDTVDIVQLSGGNPDLLPEAVRTDRLSAIVRLEPRLGLQLSADYSAVSGRNAVSPLPPTSVALMDAFPDRFLRDANGTLTQVDVRPVNFAERNQKLLRYGISLNAPLGSAGLTRPSQSAARLDLAGDSGQAEGEDGPAIISSGPRTRVQLAANHVVVFEDEIVIRPTLPPINLLDGGASVSAGAEPAISLIFSPVSVPAALGRV